MSEHIVALEEVLGRVGYAHEAGRGAELVAEMTGLHIEKSVARAWDGQTGVPESVAAKVVEEMTRVIDQSNADHLAYRIYLEQRRQATIAQREADALRKQKERERIAREAHAKSKRAASKPDPRVAEEIRKQQAAAVDMGVGAVSFADFRNPAVRMREAARLASAPARVDPDVYRGDL